MSEARLETLTLKALATSAKAAGHALKAARVGSRRLIDAFDAQVTEATAARLEPHARRVAGQMRHYGGKAHAQALRSVDVLGDRVDAGLQRGADGAAAQVKRLAKAAFGVQNPLLAKGLAAVAQASVPGARLAQTVSERVAAATAGWPKAVAGAAGRRRVRTAAPAKGRAAARSQAGAKPAPARAAAQPVRRAAKPGKAAVTGKSAARTAPRRAKAGTAAA